jgi:hypothetical protein
MSTTTSSILIAISQQVVIYMGISIVVLGVFGNLLNMMVFLSLKTFRQSSCAFYLIIMSCVNIGQLLAGQLTRVMITGFNIDWTQTSLFYCKFRLFAIIVCSFISFTCICYATIDQYFATCVGVYWQQWSNIKLARRLTTISILCWIIYAIPYLIFVNQIVSSPGKIICGLTNQNFRQYHIYINTIILSGGLPVLITAIFGTLAFRNIRQIAYRAVALARRELDKQLTNMVLIQVLFGFSCISPYIVLSTLPLVTSISSDPVAAAQVNAVINIAACVYYLYFAVSIYVPCKLLNII